MTPAWRCWLRSPAASDLWDAVADYVRACRGNPNKHVYGNTPRQEAVARIDNIIRPLVEERARLRAENARLAREIKDARAALGAAWLLHGATLAEGIALKTTQLERLANEGP